MDNATLCLTPHGRLRIEGDAGAQLAAVFERGSGHGILHLALDESGEALSPAPAWWREFGARYLGALCALGEAPVAPPEQAALEDLALSAPPQTGSEYLTARTLDALWRETDDALRAELADSHASLQDFLKRRNAAWNLVGRVHFNLAENRRDEEAPFAFLATYTTRLSGQARPQHLPLGKALSEYAGAANKPRLLSLLLPVQRAAEACAWLKAMVDAGEIFHPLRWTPAEALQLLRSVPDLESAGVVVRMPAKWSGNRPPRPQVTGTVGGKAPKGLGQEALLDFRMEITLEGEALTAAEIRELLAQKEGLALVRGRWIEVDREQLKHMMERFGQAERTAQESGLSFVEAMRLLAGADTESTEDRGMEGIAWAEVKAGPWLREVLSGLRSPQALGGSDPGEALKGTLRPYQQTGVRWLHLLTRLGLGACLADDMGLGKTIQVLGLLLLMQREKRRPSLLIVPASLLANWTSEIERFAPGLKIRIAHPSATDAGDFRNLRPEALRDTDLVITTYGSVLRAQWMTEMPWCLAILDEAQAIKNPGAKQTRAVKNLRTEARLALTGTPIENRLGDLWSLFDFINPGLLGRPKEFTSFAKRLANGPHASYGPLRELVRPYILRRLKTDRTVIADLPDKTEIQAFCPLTRSQAALYGQSVEELAGLIAKTSGIQRKGLVLSFLMRFKQICNHPSQWLGDGSWEEAESGKWARLREIAEVVAAKQEKMLVFTQFREITGPLAGFLGLVFGRPGLVLHGETGVKSRGELVRRFQEDESVGFFVLSLKAGGTGLNLTAASHVVHFDRWWNPAVENQATDRAFRIGQTKNVLVHKFVCRGTVEEKIDALIESKRSLSRELLEGGADTLLTEMNDEELLKLVALDLNKALKEN
ncbi:MAG TPA: DEAD/DEAH box helicase [Bryobacteraceae bacterium]|jgi:non-specific serine/threonine protein kinase|nr:DEAD/DEAH box helicase [Bryobacteraceae bacterium]